MNKLKSLFFGSARRWHIISAVLAVIVAVDGCGGSGTGGDGSDTLAAGAGRKVEFDGFSLVLPQDISGGDEVPGADAGGGDSGILFTFDSGGKLLIYRTSAAVDLTLQEMADVTSRANASVWRAENMIAPSIESYKMIRLGGERAMMLAGRWDGDSGGGDLRVYGTQCGDRFYLIESLHRAEWDARLAEAALSFRCEE